MKNKFKCIGSSCLLLFSLGYSYGQASLSLPATPPAAPLTGFEYYFETDPGFGNGTFVAQPPSGNITVNEGINISSLSNGFHPFGIRARNASGSWGHTYTSTVNIFTLSSGFPATPAPPDVVAAEYFINTDPGFGNGISLPLSPSNDVAGLQVPVDISALGNGVHYVYLRTRNAAGSWGHTQPHRFSILIMNLAVIPPVPLKDSIRKLEYFFDHDPGMGNGTIIDVPATVSLENFSFAANISALPDGNHTFYIRTLNGTSLTSAQTINKGTPLPVHWLSFTAALRDEAVSLTWKVSEIAGCDHYAVERSSDGRLYTEIARKAAGNTEGATLRYDHQDAAPLTGQSYYRIRQTDRDGKHSYSPVAGIYNGMLSPEFAINNPARDNLVIRWNAYQQAAGYIKIMSTSGQMVMGQVKQNESLTSLDISALKPGLYLLRVQSPAFSKTIKFIKE
jgi:hypothetical protein